MNQKTLGEASSVDCVASADSTPLDAKEDYTFESGAGYYDVTRYPLGGDFHRAKEPLKVKITGRFPMNHGCNTKGTTEDGRTICFNMPAPPATLHGSERGMV